MKRSIQILVIGALVALLSTLAFAAVPPMINYQGKLTTSTGAPVDTTISMVFTIYADSGGTISKWSETQTAVKVEKGVFNVLLGSVDSIPYLVFDGSIRYLGVKVGDDPEIIPRKPMVSVAYAYRAGAASDNDWVFPQSAGGTNPRPYLYTYGEWGIARYGNVLYGNADYTHVNLGLASTTGASGWNYIYCTVGGGEHNTASSSHTTVGGGRYNAASGLDATVGGGSDNTASGNYATVGGGVDNTASSYEATVGGGWSNTASGNRATVGGGDDNTASGSYATVPGGSDNIVAGDYSFASGRQVSLTSDADYTFAFGNNFTTSASHAVVFYDLVSEMKVGIQTTSPTARLDVSGSTGYNQIRMRTSYTPTGTNDANGNIGDIAWDDDYFYVKTSAGWKRTALSIW
jgi:hypothetical protein